MSEQLDLGFSGHLDDDLSFEEWILSLPTSPGSPVTVAEALAARSDDSDETERP